MNQLLPVFCILFSSLGVLSAADPTQIQLVQSMSYGALVIQPSGGRITLTQDGSLVPQGGVSPGGSPTAMAARFRLIGPPGGAYVLRLAPSSPTLTSTSGGAVRLESFLPADHKIEGIFDATGQAELKVGGTLNIPANTPSGPYRSSQANLQMEVKVKGDAKFTVNQPFTLSALLRSPLMLASSASLDFGSLIPGTGAGTFQVLPTGGHQAGGPSQPLLFKGSPHHAAFFLQGEAGAPVGILLPTEATLTGPNGSIKVRDFRASVPLTNVLPVGGLPFNVGGTLYLDPLQAPGNYKGVFLVTVIYL